MAIAQQAQEFNRKQPKKVTSNRFAHVANTKYGMGDSYGMGAKNPLGKIKVDQINVPLSKAKTRKPPKRLA